MRHGERITVHSIGCPPRPFSLPCLCDSVWVGMYARRGSGNVERRPPDESQAVSRNRIPGFSRYHDRRQILLLSVMSKLAVSSFKQQAPNCWKRHPGRLRILMALIAPLMVLVVYTAIGHTASTTHNDFGQGNKLPT